MVVCPVLILTVPVLFNKVLFGLIYELRSRNRKNKKNKKYHFLILKMKNNNIKNYLKIT